MNIDELYEKKIKFDINKFSLFKKILKRVHVRIKTVSRRNMNEQFCWFIVPEIIIGVPKYDQAACIAYIIDKLKDNGFNVKYIHPNTLFISWIHWVPSYVRTELKKKTGIIVNEFGEKIETEDKSDDKLLPYDINNNNSVMFNVKEPKINLNKKNYTPIQSYKPSGKLVYNEELLTKLEDKIN